MGVLLWATCLCGYDVCFRKLPDALTLPAIAVAVFWHPTCILGGLLWAGLYLRKGVGGGDVKLAVSLGIVLLSQSVAALMAAIALASLFTVVGCLLLRKSSIAHGPSMIAGAFIGGYVL